MTKSDFLRLFRKQPKDDPSEPGEGGLEKAHAVVEFSNSAYFPVFIERLEKESFRPLRMSSQTSIVESAMRANTLREVREHLLIEVKRAKVALEEEARGHNA